MDRDNRTQIDKFKDAARDLECDDDDEHFRERLKRVVKPTKSETPVAPSKGPRRGR
ncbi:hypothetical protein [Novosphingobium marinum]|uniref:hypothetical protein n=1 Tax=Novosphingobium marinum TaxID=1514948 RepID=UPI00166A2096|nr:hypothetical protein [Novosphingobium marinum]